MAPLIKCFWIVTCLRVCCRLGFLAICTLHHPLLLLQFDMIHVTPPQGPIDVIKQSSLVDPAGFVDVNKHTMQHKKYQNIFALGDCSNAPISKTAAAVSGQGAAIRKNILAVMEGKEPSRKVGFKDDTMCFHSKTSWLCQDYSHVFKCWW